MRTPLDSRPCRSFAEALFDRAERQLKPAAALSRIDPHLGIEAPRIGKQQIGSRQPN
jgi:hypothetical protein